MVLTDIVAGLVMLIEWLEDVKKRKDQERKELQKSTTIRELREQGYQIIPPSAPSAYNTKQS